MKRGLCYISWHKVVIVCRLFWVVGFRFTVALSVSPAGLLLLAVQAAGTSSRGTAAVVHSQDTSFDVRLCFDLVGVCG